MVHRESVVVLINFDSTADLEDVLDCNRDGVIECTCIGLFAVTRDELDAHKFAVNADRDVTLFGDGEPSPKCILGKSAQRMRDVLGRKIGSVRQHKGTTWKLCLKSGTRPSEY